MPVLTLTDVKNLPDKINGQTSFPPPFSEAQADYMASDNGYDSWDEMMDDMGDAVDMIYKFIIAPVLNEGNCKGEWILVEEYFGDSQSHSGWSINEIGYEGVLYPEPGVEISAKEMIDEALSQGYDMPSFGDAPPDL